MRTEGDGWDEMSWVSCSAFNCSWVFAMTVFISVLFPGHADYLPISDPVLLPLEYCRVSLLDVVTGSQYTAKPHNANHRQEFHFEEDYSGPLKNTKASKASIKGSTAKAAASQATSVMNDISVTPVVARGGSAKGGQKGMSFCP